MNCWCFINIFRGRATAFHRVMVKLGRTLLSWIWLSQNHQGYLKLLLFLSITTWKWPHPQHLEMFYFHFRVQFSGIQLIFCIQSWSGQSSNITVNKAIAFTAKFWPFYSAIYNRTKVLARSKDHRIHTCTHPWQIMKQMMTFKKKKTYIIINTCIIIYYKVTTLSCTCNLQTAF